MRFSYLVDDHDNDEWIEPSPYEEDKINDMWVKYCIDHYDWAGEDPRHADYLDRRREYLADQETRSLDLGKGV